MLRLAFDALLSRKARTILTITGVMIGSVTLLLLISLGQGTQLYLERQLKKQGSLKTISIIPNLFNIYQGKEPPITGEIIRRIEKIEHVESVLPGKVVAPLTLSSSVINDSSLAVAIPEESMKKYEKIDLSSMKRDSEAIPILLQAEEEEREKLLGSEVKLLIEEVPQSTATEKEFKAIVVGFIDAEDVGMKDIKIFLPLDAGNEIISAVGKKDEKPLESAYDRVTIRIDGLENVAFVSKEIEKLGYKPYSLWQDLKYIKTIFKAVRFILFSLGSITLFVSALGIANTLTMAVLERTREIGILRAIGASRKQITRLFLFEALSIGLIGGALGIIVTYSIGSLLNLLAIKFFVPELKGQEVSFFVLPPYIAFLGLIFVSMLSVISGYFPAKRAANLNPVEALRYE